MLTRGWGKACQKPLKTANQTRAAESALHYGMAFSVTQPCYANTALHENLQFRKYACRALLFLHRSKMKHNVADGIRNKVELPAEFARSLVNKGIYSWMRFRSLNISRKDINSVGFHERKLTVQSPVPYYLGTATTQKITTVQVKGRKPPLFSPCALQRGPSLSGCSVGHRHDLLSPL